MQGLGGRKQISGCRSDAGICVGEGQSTVCGHDGRRILDKGCGHDTGRNHRLVIGPGNGDRDRLRKRISILVDDFNLIDLRQHFACAKVLHQRRVNAVLPAHGSDQIVVACSSRIEATCIVKDCCRERPDGIGRRRDQKAMGIRI